MGIDPKTPAPANDDKGGEDAIRGSLREMQVAAERGADRKVLMKGFPTDMNGEPLWPDEMFG